MAKFGRRKKNGEPAAESPAQEPEAALEELPEGFDEELDRTTAEEGPYSIEDFDDEDAALKGRLDLGSVLLPLPQGGQIQVEMNQAGQPQGVHIGTPAGRITVAAYAAPKSPGQWREVAGDLAESLRKDGAKVTIENGPWGREVVASTPGGDLRFIGADGYRWMVRLVAAGPAGGGANDGPLATMARTMLSDTVVRRGTEPHPVRNPLPVVLPAALVQQLQAAQQQAMAQQAAAQQQATQAQSGGQVPAAFGGGKSKAGGQIPSAPAGPAGSGGQPAPKARGPRAQHNPRGPIPTTQPSPLPAMPRAQANPIQPRGPRTPRPDSGRLGTGIVPLPQQGSHERPAPRPGMIPAPGRNLSGPGPRTGMVPAPQTTPPGSFGTGAVAAGRGEAGALPQHGPTSLSFPGTGMIPASGRSAQPGPPSRRPIRPAPLPNTGAPTAGTWLPTAAPRPIAPQVGVPPTSLPPRLASPQAPTSLPQGGFPSEQRVSGPPGGPRPQAGAARRFGQQPPMGRQPASNAPQPSPGARPGLSAARPGFAPQPPTGMQRRVGPPTSAFPQPAMPPHNSAPRPAPPQAHAPHANQVPLRDFPPQPPTRGMVVPRNARQTGANKRPEIPPGRHGR